MTGFRFVRFVCRHQDASTREAKSIWKIAWVKLCFSFWNFGKIAFTFTKHAYVHNSTFLFRLWQRRMNIVLRVFTINNKIRFLSQWWRGGWNCSSLLWWSWRGYWLNNEKSVCELYKVLIKHILIALFFLDVAVFVAAQKNYEKLRSIFVLSFGFILNRSCLL